MSLSNVTILTTSFLRDGCMFECIRRIRSMLPEVSNVVVDDGYPSVEKLQLAKEFKQQSDHFQDHQYIQLPFDSGLPAKRNAGIQAVKTKYVLMGCDDFDFGNVEARMGIQQLRGVLDLNPEIDVASGRRANEPYEGFMDIVSGQYIKETRLDVQHSKPYTTTPHPAYKVDLTVNYFLARLTSIQDLPWDERMKIGGEHGDWFLDLKAAGRTVVWVPGVNITEFQVPKGIHADYNKYRGRAVNLGHKIFLEKRGVRTYKGFDDKV